jgi:hypothetical protein
VCTRVGNQSNLRLCDVSEFADLLTIYISPLGSKAAGSSRERENRRLYARSMNCARGITVDYATNRAACATTDTYVSPAKNLDTELRTVTKRKTTSSPTYITDQPSYMRDFNFIWSNSDYGELASITMTLHAPPLPMPPQKELDNQLVSDTNAQNPHLFAIITPVKVNCFEKLLKSHPNHPLIDSVC